MNTGLDVSHTKAHADMARSTCVLLQTSLPLSPGSTLKTSVCVVHVSMDVVRSVSLPGSLKSGPTLGLLCQGPSQGKWEELRFGTGLGNRLSPPGHSGWGWGSKTFLTRSSEPAASLSGSQGGGWGERMIASPYLARERAQNPATSQPKAGCQESFSAFFPL